MNFFRVSFSLFLLAAPLLAAAQLAQPARLEVEIGYNDEYPTLISAEEEGIMLVQYLPKEGKISEKAYAIKMYTNALDSLWGEVLILGNAYDFVGYDYNQGNIYLLFRDQKTKSDAYLLYAYNAESGIKTSHTIDKAIPLELSEFIVRDGVALIGGYVNFRPTVLYYRTSDDSYKVLPGLYNQSSEILQLTSDKGTGTLTALISEEATSKAQTIAIKTYTKQGNLIFDYSLKPEKGNNLLNGYITSFSEEAVHIAGTYAPSRSKYSRGLFVATINAKGKQDTKFYPYSSLDNFFSYLPEKREKKMKERIGRKKKSGRTPKMNYRLLMHEVIESDSTYILLGEAFYPKYGNRNIFPASVYGGGQMARSMGGVEGYKYTHAVVMGFNEEGKMLWDNTFAIKDVLSYVPQKYVYVLPLHDRTVLLYMYEGEIRWKVIRGSEVLQEPETNSLALPNDNDKVRYTDEDFGGIEKWYGRYVLAYGVQRIYNQNETINGKSTRRVFFVNKITYQPKADTLGKQ